MTTRALPGMLAPRYQELQDGAVSIVPSATSFTWAIHFSSASTVGSMVEKAVAEDGQVVVRKRMRVTMSCDHRVIDGATGAEFLQTVRRMLENPLAIVW